MICLCGKEMILKDSFADKEGILPEEMIYECNCGVVFEDSEVYGCCWKGTDGNYVIFR